MIFTRSKRKLSFVVLTNTQNPNLEPITILSIYLGKSQTKLQMSYNRDRDYGRGRKRGYDIHASKNVKGRSPSTKPVEIGKIYEVNITEITGKGDGIAECKDL